MKLTVSPPDGDLGGLVARYRSGHRCGSPIANCPISALRSFQTKFSQVRLNQ
jgi:hypothetical protein